jgi:hypothetical protein
MAGNQEQQQQLSDETLKLAALGRGEVVDGGEADDGVADDGNAAGADGGSDAIPDYVPEKFRKDGKADYESLAKAYAELEKKLGQPKGKEDGDDGEPSGDPDGDAGGDDGDGSDATPISAELFSSAQTEWAEKGELTAETREKIIGSGIPAETLDTYLAGVAALSAALTASVYQAAGGEEAYTSAVEWARDNWKPAQIEKFDHALNDPDLMPVMVKALMADYADANPGEGSQTRGGNGGGGDSDLYHDPEEFTRDLAAADLKNDAVARRKAIQKLERSKKAKTLKHVTPRSGVSQLLG